MAKRKSVGRSTRAIDCRVGSTSSRASGLSNRINRINPEKGGKGRGAGARTFPTPHKRRTGAPHTSHCAYTRAVALSPLRGSPKCELHPAPRDRRAASNSFVSVLMISFTRSTRSQQIPASSSTLQQTGHRMNRIDDSNARNVPASCAGAAPEARASGCCTRWARGGEGCTPLLSLAPGDAASLVGR